jgi:hypothetical protein
LSHYLQGIAFEQSPGFLDRRMPPPMLFVVRKLRPNPLLSRYRDGVSGDGVITLPRAGLNIR